GAGSRAQRGCQLVEFNAPQFQQPDLLGAYLRGQQGAIQSALAPGELQLQQQGIQHNNLTLDQLRLALRQQSARTDLAMQAVGSGQSPAGGAEATVDANGGIQNGPQGAVSQPQAPQYDPNNPLAPFLDPRRIAAYARLAQFDAIIDRKDPNEATANALKLATE